MVSFRGFAERILRTFGCRASNSAPKSQKKLSTDQKAKLIVGAIEKKETIESIKGRICKSEDEWGRISPVAYQLCLRRERQERDEMLKKPHVRGTSNAQIGRVLDLNEALAKYAASITILSTISDIEHLELLAGRLPTSEPEIIDVIGRITMHPRYRTLQKKGRISKFPHFSLFPKMIDAATLSYYRTNFTSCYLTLLPIVEGIIIRWMGYADGDEKPEFEQIRKFFRLSYTRQPCPYNIAFHNVYTKVCDKILNEHFFRPSTKGTAFSNFNRHVASHILNDNQFATKANCIRLFNLIDTMTEIYLYESRGPDPRWALRNEELEPEVTAFASTLMNNISGQPEHTILGTSPGDVLDDNRVGWS